ncbi:MAG: heme biosynthesis protein HemY [Proteobacteria bacterium]|nr:heme biosynthesis protein HemY [Pseudomonadota bacterium]
MRGVIWIVLLFTVAVVAATTLGSNDGLVSIYWRGWRTDLSLNLFILLVLGLCVIGVAAAHAISRLVSLPRRAGEWRALRRERAAQAALRDAMVEFHGARYGRARKAAAKALALQDDAPALGADGRFGALAHLLAAASQHRLQDGPGRDEQVQRVLDAAHREAGIDRGMDDAVRLLAAEWALDDHDAGRALELLAMLPPGVARRTQALRLKLQAARLARQPLEALRTARLLANHQAFSPLVARSLLRSLAAEVLDDAHDLQQLKTVWQQLDPADREDVPVLARAAARAVALGAAGQAREWLQPWWNRLAELDRDERDLVALALFDARRGLARDWLPRIERVLQTHGLDSAVQVAAGGAFVECGLWGKARPLLEAAALATVLPARTRRAAWRELAALARREGDDARAAGCDREAARID